MAYTYIGNKTTLADWANWAKEVNDSELNSVRYEFHKPEPDPSIMLHTHAGDEMIKITKEGFYVRGIKVEQDDKEAETVYNAFKQWLAWAQLQRGN